MPCAARKCLLAMTLAVVVAAALLAGFLWSGIYDIGADAPHWQPVQSAVTVLRDHSIRARSKNLKPPNLDDEQRVLVGAGHYAAMCSGCHLAPGMKDSEIRPGLYPQPPELARVRLDPRDAFWVIKHGVKMSGMPAWGGSHDDDTIWSMVAFVHKLPDLTPAQYQAIVAKAPADEDMDGDDGDHGAPMAMPASAHDSHATGNPHD